MAAVLIGLREGLEAALIVGILLGALRRLGKADLTRYVWLGVAAALLVSFAVAGGLVAADVQFTGRAEAVFEGITLIIAASFLTGMIFWMKRQGVTFRSALEADVQDAALTASYGGRAWGLAAIAFLAVVREGLEYAPNRFSG